jgi:hypothetical protein
MPPTTKQSIAASAVDVTQSGVDVEREAPDHDEEEQAAHG